MSKLEQAIADRFMRMQIKGYVKKLVKKGIKPTVEQVMQDMDNRSLGILLQYGYTEEKIRQIAEDIIGRLKWKE